jgi:hypothetical protein
MTQQTSDVAARVRSTRRRATLVGADIPIVLTAIAAVVMATWIPDLPDPVAVHWSGDTPDGFGDVWLMLLTPLGVSGLFGIFAAGVIAKPTEHGLLMANQKIALVLSVWLAGLLGVGVTGTLWVQRGLEDAADASGGAIWLLWGAIAGIVLAVPAWFLLPESDSFVPMGERPQPIELAATELVSWSRSVAPGLAPRLIVGGVLVVVFVASLFTASAGSPAFGTVTVTAAGLVIVVSATMWWRVTIDRRGLVVRSVLGWPRVSIPASEIRDVAIADVNPSADFGGWGWRAGSGGRSGIILRAGEAIEVTRANGKRFVVTVDDASTGAAVLAGIAAR